MVLQAVMDGEPARHPSLLASSMYSSRLIPRFESLQRLRGNFQMLMLFGSATLSGYLMETNHLVKEIYGCQRQRASELSMQFATSYETTESIL
ncbi:hypothetical protein L596_027951 [Steinernema carpocapsae]|uniref:Uncharacterized protein n=1 Tax=Steinernema carpocapsae TaxID=34508 RepID=A0A4V5ZXR3_STECR|nr:hypothetical protein L596_027951 [Steinernema carpocapsae]